MSARRDGPATLAGLALVGLGFVPLAAWLGDPAQRTAALARVAEWPQGVLLTALATVLVVLVLGRVRPPAETLPPFSRGPGLERALLAAAFLLPLAVAWFVLERHPLLIDEGVQVLQARTYASGHLADPLPAAPEFTAIMHEAEHAGRRFGQFPPGWPAFLAPFTLLGAEWLAGPLVALLVACLLRALLVRIEPDPRARTLALAVLVLAPFTWFMGGSHMNHGLATAGILLGVLGAVRLLEPDGARLAAWGVACGAGFGLAVATRPLDGAAFAAPAALVLLAAAVRRADRRLPVCAAALAGAVALGLVAWVNWSTTGAPTRFGYQLLWGPSHDLGFHPAPWGPAHTPVRGLAILNGYFLKLQQAFFEAPLPSLVPATIALFLARRSSTGDRLLLAGSALLLTGYWAYWHDGDFLGPRFLVPLGPVVAIWTGRLPSLLGETGPRGPLLRRTGYVLLGVVAVTALLFGVPVRWLTYRSGFTSMRWPVSTWAAQAGVTNGLVFVRESWGAQLVVRLWRLGIGRTESERLYRNTDACRLEHGISALEAAGAPRGAAAFRALAPLMADSARLRGSPVTSDTSERWLPGSPYDARCLARAGADSAGSLLYLPFRLAQDGNLYVRDLHELNGPILQAHPDRPRWLALRTSRRVDAGIRFVPLTDSLALR